MPYQIYTYTDPYKLHQTDFWNKICCLPHFCGARTLVNGLRSIHKKNIHGLLAPFDTLVNHAEVYGNWTKNIPLHIQQYSELTSYIEKRFQSADIDELFYKSLKHNQSHMLDAIRLFIELDIDVQSMEYSAGNREQRFFMDALKDLSTRKSFLFPASPNAYTLNHVLKKISNNELDEYRKRAKERSDRKGDDAWYQQALRRLEREPVKAIVIHGIHQFSPAEIRLITNLDRSGFKIIFLYNYQEKYSEIYSSWNNIYHCFEAPIHNDTKITCYSNPDMQNPSYALACAIGEMCQTKKSLAESNIFRLYPQYKSIPFLEFANITEYAHYVSNHFELAKREYANSLNTWQQGNQVWKHSDVLKFTDEQVYTANRDIHTLLKIYFPDYVKERHFLAFPIGQFFSSIYRLWDYEERSIKIDIPLIKECLSSNILHSGAGYELLRTFTNVEIVFEGITTFSDFKTKVEGQYLRNYHLVTQSKKQDNFYPFRALSIYNTYIVSEKDLKALIQAINEINEIANHLFVLDDSYADFIKFGDHFRSLEDFLKQRELTLATEQERNLIQELISRLEMIQPENTSFSGTFQDLQQGLHFFLKQKTDEETDVDWIVKNFEQIDGDILQTKLQKDQGRHRDYHFACLSDRDLNYSVDDLLPWPLSEAFIQKAYSPIDLPFQVYYTSLSERSGFLRYALFYGLYYNICGAILSYVRQYDDNETEPYSLLTLLGLETKTAPASKDVANPTSPYSPPKDSLYSHKFSDHEMMDMYLCPYRYFLDYVLDDQPVMRGSFLYQKFYENYIISKVWKEIENSNKNTAKATLNQRIKKYRKLASGLFGFWKSSEMDDLDRRARNYLLHNVIEDKRSVAVKRYNEAIVDIRKLFGAARFDIPLSDHLPVNPYPSFENLTETNPSQGKKVYSLAKQINRISKNNDALSAMKQYLYTNERDSKESIVSDWCTYCVHKGNCMQPYLDGN